MRGLRYQFAGPLDEDDNPVGGRSLFEINAELRTRVTKNLGIGLFVDGGSVFGESYPSFSETIRWGAGAGLRYFTPIGPLRFDFAVPVNKRNADDSFQFYISLGPSF